MADLTRVKGTVRNKRTWTPEEDEKLINALTELHTTGKYAADNGFKPGYFQAVQSLLETSLPNLGLKAEPHIKSRLKTLKTNFSTMHDMVVGSSTSGFGWDPDKCVLIAPIDVWDEYIKSHKNAALFRDKPIPYNHKLCTIFGKDRATGSRAIDLGEEEVVVETQASPQINLEDLDVDTGVDSPRGDLGRMTKKRKREKTEKIDEMMQMYYDSCNMLHGTIATMGSNMNASLSKMANDQDREERIAQKEMDLLKRVQIEIDGLPDITFEEACEATYIIGSCPRKSGIFFGYDQEKKVKMVKMVARKATR